MMNILKSKPPQGDEELARAVRDAAKAYNDAVSNARNNGLSISARAQARHSSHNEWISDRLLYVDSITRTETKRL
jgi:hypothetical protein